MSNFYTLRRVSVILVINIKIMFSLEIVVCYFISIKYSYAPMVHFLKSPKRKVNVCFTRSSYCYLHRILAQRKQLRILRIFLRYVAM